MPDEKHHYEPQEQAPIPTYEEATSSHAFSRLGASEISSDAERQGLLAPSHAVAVESSSRRRNGYYQPPSVQSVRSSEDSLDRIEDVNSEGEEEEEELRREVEEMDIEDEAADGAAMRRRRRQQKWNAFSQRIAGFTAGLSRFRIPTFKIPWPNFGWITERITIPNIPERYRPSWPVVARLVGLGLIVMVIYLLVASNMFPGLGRSGFAERLNPEWVRQFALGQIDAERIAEYTRRVTEYDHVAGTQGSYTLGKYVETQFLGANMDQVIMEEYHAYLNYPEKTGRRVAIVDPPDMAWDAELEEPNVYGGDGKTSHQQSWVYHALSKSGSAKGPLVYANYGSKEDFKSLADSHIDVEGTIVLMRQGGRLTSQASKIRNAQNRGAIGALIYSDPKDDGFAAAARADDVAPNGRYRPQDSVQRGSAAMSSWILGDVLTPNEPSLEHVHRISKDDNSALPKIPSLPLSWRNAKKLLQSLKGHGQELSEDIGWQGGVPEVDNWWTGNKTSPTVYIENKLVEEDKQPIHNVLGIIQGLENSNHKLIVGNHRDSWCFGAADPGSGTAVMLEVIRILGLLRKQGWRPLRAIIFASWDASEYNLIGSTEFVEGHLDDLRVNGIAYLNVNTGVTGDKLHASGSPALSQAFLKSINRVADPERNKTFSEIWQEEGVSVEGPTATNDAAAFQFLAGVPSLDFGFSGAPIPLHSCSETFEWFSNYVDPTVTYRKALVQIWVLLILELSQEALVSLNYRDYAESIRSYIATLEDFGNSHGAPWEGNDKGEKFDLNPLRVATDELLAHADEFQKWERHWYSRLMANAGFESNVMAIHRITHNSRAVGVEAGLLDWPENMRPERHVQYGLPGRDQYKHTLFAPDRDDPGLATFFPFVRDAIIDGNWTVAQTEIEKAADRLRKTGERLAQ